MTPAWYPCAVPSVYRFTMKKNLTLTLLMCILSTATSAQTVESIRNDYNEAKSLQSSEVPQNNYQIIINRMYGGSGQHNETVTMIPRVDYDEQGDSPGDPIFTPFMITSKFNWAARNYYREFLYSDKGKLEFIYAKDIDDEDFSEIEYRFYIGTSGVIKVVVNHKNANEDKFSQEYSGKTLTPKYKKAYERFSNSAAALLKLFLSLNQF